MTVISSESSKDENSRFNAFFFPLADASFPLFPSFGLPTFGFGEGCTTSSPLPGPSRTTAADEPPEGPGVAVGGGGGSPPDDFKAGEPGEPVFWAGTSTSGTPDGCEDVELPDPERDQ